jgi:hypothetical protein
MRIDYPDEVAKIVEENFGVYIRVGVIQETSGFRPFLKRHRKVYPMGLA